MTIVGDTIYVADARQLKIWSFRDGEAHGQIAIDLSNNIGLVCPVGVTFGDGSLYVLYWKGFASQHPLPATIDLQLAA